MCAGQCGLTGGPHFGVATSEAKRRDQQKGRTREQEEVTVKEEEEEEDEEDEVKTSTDRESRLLWAAAESGEEARGERAPASGPEGVSEGDRIG